MKPLLVTLLLLIFNSSSLISQSDSLSFNTYYDSDNYGLLESHQSDLNLFFEKIDLKRIEKIILFGHTDSDASDEYNNALSKNRVDGVYDFLIQKGFKKEFLEKKYFGEFVPIATNENEFGKGKNRRVETLVLLKKKKRKIIHITKTTPSKKQENPKPKKEKIKEVKPDNKCNRDTIIELRKGVQAAINICTYEKIKDCITIKIHNDIDALVADGITTYDTQGTPLNSCGMATVNVKESCAPCFATPIKIRFPVLEDCRNEPITNPSSYDLRNGQWQLNRSNRIKKKTIKRIRYFEMEFTCAGMQNCDDPKCPEPIKIKFKNNRKQNFLSANIVNICSNGNFPLKIDKRGRAKGDISRINKDYYLFAKVINRQGDTIQLKEPLIYSPSIKILEGKCYCDFQPFFSLTHFPMMRNSNASFSPNEVQGQFSNNIFTGNSFTSLEFILAEYPIHKEFSYQLGGGIYRNYFDGNLLLENQELQLKNGIQQVGFNGNAAINSPYFWDGFSTTLFTQFGFGTNFAKLQSNENFEILDQEKLNGWGMTSNFGLTLDSPRLLKKFKISIGGTYNITFTNLAEFKTFQFVFAEPEQSHKIKFTSQSNTILATLRIKYYL